MKNILLLDNYQIISFRAILHHLQYMNVYTEMKRYSKVSQRLNFTFIYILNFTI